MNFERITISVLNDILFSQSDMQLTENWNRPALSSFPSCYRAKTSDRPNIIYRVGSTTEDLRNRNQCTTPTKRVPPMMFPRVTGKRLFTRNPYIVKADRSGTLIRISWAAAIISGFCFRSSPAGMKYILATECSNPRATNAVIGNRMARILSVTDRPLKQR